MNFMILFVGEEFPVGSHAFHADEHLAARGVVEELHTGLALAVGPHVGQPVEGAAEVLHGGKIGIVVHLKLRRDIETVEMGDAEPFGRDEERAVGITIEDHGIHILNFITP